MSKDKINDGEHLAPLEKDTALIIISVIKISASFIHLDELMDSKKYYKHKFKKESRAWLSLMEKHTNSLLSNLTQEHPEVLEKMYNVVADSLNKVQLKDKDQTALACFYAFVKSSLNDLNEMGEKKDNFYPYLLRMSNQRIASTIESKYKFITEIVDCENKTVSSLIDFLDDLGKTIISIK